MPSIGVTGSLGSGKSSVSVLLAEFLQGLRFDADRQVHQILAGEEEVINAIREHFGDCVFANDSVDRAKLRNRVFASFEERKWLENLLHPRVRAVWRRMAQENGPNSFLVAEIPLLFESGADSELDFTVAVECSLEVRTERLRTNRGMSEDAIAKILAAQFEVAKKLGAADFVIWNDGNLSQMEAQVRVLAERLRSRVPYNSD